MAYKPEIKHIETQTPPKLHVLPPRPSQPEVQELGLSKYKRAIIIAIAILLGLLFIRLI